MPTGAGKSLCFQIPALAKSGIVLVICPLIGKFDNYLFCLHRLCGDVIYKFLSSLSYSAYGKKAHFQSTVHAIFFKANLLVDIQRSFLGKPSRSTEGERDPSRVYCINTASSNQREGE